MLSQPGESGPDTADGAGRAERDVTGACRFTQAPFSGPLPHSDNPLHISKA